MYIRLTLLNYKKYLNKEAEIVWTGLRELDLVRDEGSRVGRQRGPQPDPMDLYGCALLLHHCHHHHR